MISDQFDSAGQDSWEDMHELSGMQLTRDRDNAILWARAILEQDFLVLDTETTGLEYDDEAVSIGLIDKQGTILLNTLLRHTKRSEPGAEAVHGITWEMTRAAPTFAEVYEQLSNLSLNRVVVGYNLRFDTRIVIQTCQRYDLPALTLSPPIKSLRFSASRDVMARFAAFYGAWSDYHQSYTWQKLTVAAQHFGLDTDNAHDAAADARLTLEIVKAMAAAKLSGEVEDG